MQQNSDEEWVKIINEVVAFKEEIISQIMQFNRMLQRNNAILNDHNLILVQKLNTLEEYNKKMKQREKILDAFLSKELNMNVVDVDEFITKFNYEAAVEKRNKEKEQT